MSFHFHDYYPIYTYIKKSDTKYQGTKFAPTYAPIFMDEIETNFLDTQYFKLLVWFRYIDDVFFIWTHGKEKLEEFLKRFQ